MVTMSGKVMMGDIEQGSDNQSLIPGERENSVTACQVSCWKKN